MVGEIISNPAVMRKIAYLRDFGMSWAKVTEQINRTFDAYVSEASVKKAYKEYTNMRSELISESPETRQRLQRDLLYALEKMDSLEGEVQELLDVIKDKDVKETSDYKLILQCVEKMQALLEKRVTLLQGVQPKQKNQPKISTMNVTQNIVNKLDELEEMGAITINRPGVSGTIDVETREVVVDAKESPEEGTERQSEDRRETGHEPGRIPGDETELESGDRNPLPEEEGTGEPAGADTQLPDYSGAPVVTISTTKAGIGRGEIKNRATTERDKQDPGDKNTGE